MSYDAPARDGDQTVTLGLSVEMVGMLGLLVLVRDLHALCFRAGSDWSLAPARCTQVCRCVARVSVTSEW